MRTIVGVVESGIANEVYVMSHIFQLAGVKNYSQVKIEVDSQDNVWGLRKQIEALGFTTISPIDTVEQISEIFRFFNVILVGFGGIGMLVATLGMFNMLTISLLERTKEIGLMITLGARRKDMRKLFILEAVVLSFIGAAIGIAVAYGLGRLVDWYMNSTARQRGVEEYFTLFYSPPLLILSLIGAMMLIGLLVVYYPARRAEKINPIDALRRE